MAPDEYFNSHSAEAVEAVAVAAGTTYNNFRHIAIYKGACSARLALRLSESSGGAMTLAEIISHCEKNRAA